MLVNRTPHFTTQTRREANRALDLLEGQLGLNQVSVPEAARGMELLLRAHSSLAFGLLRDSAFAERFSAALRHLGLRGIEQRLDEVTGSVMAEPIPGQPGADAIATIYRPTSAWTPKGNPLPPLPGF